MIKLIRENTTQNIVVTLDEKKTSDAVQYVFVFTNVVSKYTIDITVLLSDDISEYPERYNEFSLNIFNWFDGQPLGQWTYQVFQNTIGGILLETGRMDLVPSSDITITGHTQTLNYKGYAG